MTRASTANVTKYSRNQRETMSAGTSISQKRMGWSLALLAVVLGLWSVTTDGQTGQVMPQPVFTAYDANGDPCAGCKLYAYAAGTTTPQDTYTSAALSVANANPVVLDAAGRATVFVNPALSYKFTLQTAGNVDIWTVDNVVGPFSGVTTVTAANTRGLQISRSAAEAGLSIASTGGSGKTWGLASLTTGQLRIQDDDDATPRIELGVGNAIALVTTGTTTISGAGGLAVTGGASALQAVTATTGAFSSNLSAGGTFSASGNVGLGTASTTRRVTVAGVGNTSGAVADGGDKGATLLVSSTAGGGSDGGSIEFGFGYGAYAQPYFAAVRGLGVDSANNTTGSLAFFTRAATSDSSLTKRLEIAPGGTITATGPIVTSAQPSFSAYNSADDANVGSTVTVEFDTADFNIGSHFNTTTDTFTAPVTGNYMFCASVTVENDSGGATRFRLILMEAGGPFAVLAADEIANAATQTISGCMINRLTAADTRSIRLYSDGSTTHNVLGYTAVNFGRRTQFSGYLLP